MALIVMLLMGRLFKFRRLVDQTVRRESKIAVAFREENMKTKLLIALSQSGTKHRDNIHWQGPYSWFADSKKDI